MTRKITLAGILIANALVLSFIERMIPISFGVPGVKLGLANIVVLIAIYMVNPLFALFVQMGRILLSGMMFTGLGTMLYSLAGGLLSWLVMSGLFKMKKWMVSIVGISVAGAVFHNIGQIGMASIMVRNISLVYYLPILMVSGVITGIFIGLVARYLISGLRKTGIFGGLNEHHTRPL